MRRVLTILAFSAVFSMVAMAENWSGRLLDETCYAQQKKADSCDATSTTSSFAIDVSGKVYKLDPADNTKVSTAMKNRADRSTNPNQPLSKQVMAQITGTEKGGTITVESIEVR